MVGWRRLWGPAVAAIALMLLDPEMARAEPGVPVPPNGLLTDKAQGSISAADKDFVTKVRLAGLWEIPAGDMAQEKSDDPRIKQIGATIAAQHKALDELTRTAAKKLKIDLPDKPNSDQQKWLGEMRDATGTDFDQIYIDRLRAAHGKIFPAIATIRASTRNDTVRRLAQQANQFVMTHMTLLESSGIVDFQGLPTAPPPTTSAAPTTPVAARQSSLPGSGTPIVLLALAGGVLAGIIATRLLVSRRPRRYYRG
jgi:predicted outer membrane protein